ncbi:hypothetical protein C8J56DRAFT_898897 [Mycena floridula]|nr:hypothetical protein C8J56DRAFT_898897 [Mycena floridula]
MEKHDSYIIIYKFTLNQVQNVKRWSLTSLHLLISNGMGKTWSIDPDPLSTPPRVRFLCLHYPHASPTSTHGDKGTRRPDYTELRAYTEIHIHARSSPARGSLLPPAPRQNIYGLKALAEVAPKISLYQLDKAMQRYMAIRCRQIGDPINGSKLGHTFVWWKWYLICSGTSSLMATNCFMAARQSKCAKNTEENQRKEEKKAAKRETAANEQQTEEEKKKKQAEQERRWKLETGSGSCRAEHAAAKMTGASVPRTSSSA